MLLRSNAKKTRSPRAPWLGPAFVAAALALGLAETPACAQMVPQSSVSSAPQTSYVYIERTNAYLKFYPAPEEFQKVARDIRDYLATNHVATTDARDTIAVSGKLPLYALQDMARDAGAGYVLHVVVDRPTLKWLKVTVRCYDQDGKELWKEEAGVSGGLTGKNAERDTLLKLRSALDRRLGQAGLFESDPTAKSAELAAGQGASAPPAEGHDESGADLKLANGTPLRLLVAERVSSKTAEPGSIVKLQVFGEVKAGGLVVIANKAPATATIEDAKNAGAAWRRGTLLLKMGTVTLLNSGQQPLRAWSSARGEDTGAPAAWSNAIIQSYGLALFLLPLAPLQHGNDAILPRGTVLEAVISGDVLLPRDVISAAQPKPAEPRQGPASVTFYYPDTGDGPKESIWCGTLKIGRLARGGKFTVALPGGTYLLRLWNGKNSPFTTLEAAEGGEYFVRVSRSQHHAESRGPVSHEDIEVAQHDIGEAESADATTTKASELRDPAMLDLAQLQAQPRTKRN